MSRVFVYEPVKTDIAPAQVFGEVVYLFTETIYRPSIWETQALQQAIFDRLVELDFSPDEDFVAVVGPMIPVMLVFTVLDAAWGNYKVLLWNAEHREYQARKIYQAPLLTRK